MNTTGLLAGTAGFAMIGAFWDHIKQFFVKFKSLFIVSAKVTYSADRALIRYLWQNFRCGMLGNKFYTGNDMFVRSKKSYEAVVFQDVGESQTFFKGWKPITVSREGDEVNITFIRGTFQLEKLLTDSIDAFNDFEKNQDKENSRYYVRHIFGSYSLGEGEAYKESAPEAAVGNSSHLRPIGYKWDNLGPLTSKTPFSTLFYPDEIQEFMKYLERWKGSEDWYKKRALAWRMGALLEGPPGTGKSSFVRAIGQHFDFPIDVYDLISMSNSELTKYWRKSLNRAPCIVLIEDIDRIFDKDKLMKEDSFSGKGKLTMDGLLNVISGVEPADGILLFITANDASKIDPALGVTDEHGISTRPGRIDKVLTFGTLPEECRTKMANVILADCKHLAEETIVAGENETGAQFGKRCSDIALKEFWGTGDDFIIRASEYKRTVKRDISIQDSTESWQEG